jgi:hypothetical protein
MKGSALTLFGLAVVVACSGERNRSIPADAPELAVDLRLPDTSQQDSVAEQPATPPPVEKVKPRRAPRPKPAVAPETPVEDTVSSQAYAPDAGGDSSPADTITPIERVDTAIERVAAPTNPDSSPEVVTRDSVAPIRSGAVSAPAADTALMAAKDSMVGRDPVAASPTPVPPPAASTAATTLPIGTEIKVSLDDSINSRHDTVGRTVSAHVMENVVAAGGQTVIAAGAPVRLTITKLEPAKSKSAAAGKLAFRVDGIAMGGELQKVQADVRPVPHELRGRGVTAGDAGKVGVGAVGGAVLGRVIGGNTRGAVIGGVVGAAGGAVVASQTASRDVVVKAKTPVVFVLTETLVAR